MGEGGREGETDRYKEAETKEASDRKDRRTIEFSLNSCRHDSL